MSDIRRVDVLVTTRGQQSFGRHYRERSQMTVVLRGGADSVRDLERKVRRAVESAVGADHEVGSRLEILRGFAQRSAAEAEAFRLELAEMKERRSAMVDGDRMSDEQCERARETHLKAQGQRAAKPARKRTGGK